MLWGEAQIGGRAEKPVTSPGGFVRGILKRLLTGEGQIVLENCVPSLDDRLDGLAELGLYLHIPFCRQICSYCPVSYTHLTLPTILLV